MNSLKKKLLYKIETYIYDVAVSHVKQRCFSLSFEPKVPDKLKKQEIK